MIQGYNYYNKYNKYYRCNYSRLHNFRQKNFSDFSRIFKDKLQFSRTKIYSEFKNLHSLIPFWTPHAWLKHIMESFAVFTSSATVDHVIFYFPHQHSAKWLAIFYCILGAERIWNKETEVKYCSCTKMLLCYPWVSWVLTRRMSQNFLSKKTLIFTENCVRCRQGSEFQGLFKTL